MKANRLLSAAAALLLPIFVTGCPAVIEEEVYVGGYYGDEELDRDWEGSEERAYKDGYRAGSRDANRGRSHLAARHRDNVPAPLYRFFREGYRQGYDDVAAYGRGWGPDRDRYYDRGYELGRRDRSRGRSRFHTRYADDYEPEAEPYFRRGYEEGWLGYVGR